MSNRIAKARLRISLNAGFVFVAVVLLCLPIPRTSAVVSVPQGKGGEVIAKPTPTPTPKKTTRKRAGNRPSGSSAVDELAFWETIKNSTDPEDFNAYLKQYPKGKFVTLAKNRLKTLEAAQPKPTATPNAAEQTPTNTSGTNNKSNNTSGGSGTTSRIPTTLPRTRTNQTGIEFALIPPGHFMMGSTNGGDWEKPVHEVTINYSFYMGKYEVTQAQWQSVMGNNPSRFKGDSLPVESVSWFDAQQFLQRLNQMNDGFTYRLPTEAEWEYGARAGTTTNYYWGDDRNQACRYANVLDQTAKPSHPSWTIPFECRDGYADSSPVGNFRPNGWDLYDITGNVWEWCEDWYHPSYEGAPSDGSAWLSGGEQKSRVARGGSFAINSDLRLAARNAPYPESSDYDRGVRVVAVPKDFVAASQPTNPNSTNSGSSKSAMPPNPLLPLHSFDFVTVTLDKDGKLKSRETKSANAYTEDFGGGVKLEMVAIPPGEFMMGTAAAELGLYNENEEPQHRVRIGYSYFMGQFELTQAQWRAVMGTNPSYFKDCDACPVEQVSWNDAVEFCRKLSARTGREYRLPSEAEWEYAARAGTTTRVAFGEAITSEIANYDGDGGRSYYDPLRVRSGSSFPNRQKTIPVGSLRVANAFGLYDMYGNVQEWCQDWYHDNYSAIAGDAPTDGSAWLTVGEKKWKVARGGNWFFNDRYTTSASRVGHGPDNRSYTDGFRVVAVARTQ
jgi:formylglycine-generating enzyme required for sulfatase activity